MTTTAQPADLKPGQTVRIPGTDLLVEVYAATVLYGSVWQIEGTRLDDRDASSSFAVQSFETVEVVR